MTWLREKFIFKQGKEALSKIQKILSNNFCFKNNRLVGFRRLPESFHWLLLFGQVFHSRWQR